MHAHVPPLPLSHKHVRRKDVRDLHTHVRLHEGSQVVMALAHKAAEGPDELRKGSEPALQCGGAGEWRGAFCGGVAGLDPTAVGVADDDDVLDVEVFDRVGEHCGRVVVVRMELTGGDALVYSP